MKIFIFSFVLLSSLLLNRADAAGFGSYYCEKGFRSVQVGDTIEAVRAACGDPTAINNRAQQTSKSVEVERWVYALGTLNTKGVFINLPGIALTIRDKKVIEIYRAGSAVADASCSFMGIVHVGDSVEQVLSVCGNPGGVSRMQQPVAAEKTMTEWVYNFGPYKPQIIFEFEEGRVVQIVSGQLGK